MVLIAIRRSDVGLTGASSGPATAPDPSHAAATWKRNSYDEDDTGASGLVGVGGLWGNNAWDFAGYPL